MQKTTRQVSFGKRVAAACWVGALTLALGLSLVADGAAAFGWAGYPATRPAVVRQDLDGAVPASRWGGGGGALATRQ